MQKTESVSCETTDTGRKVYTFRIPNDTNDFIELTNRGCSLDKVCVHGANGEIENLLAHGTCLLRLNEAPDFVCDTLAGEIWDVAEVGAQHVLLSLRVPFESEGEAAELTAGVRVKWYNLNRLIVDLYITPSASIDVQPVSGIAFAARTSQECGIRTFCPRCITDGEEKDTEQTPFKELSFRPLAGEEHFSDPETESVRPMMELTGMTEKTAISVYGDLGFAAAAPKTNGVLVTQGVNETVRLLARETWSARVIYGVDRVATPEF